MAARIKPLFNCFLMKFQNLRRKIKRKNIVTICLEKNESKEQKDTSKTSTESADLFSASVLDSLLEFVALDSFDDLTVKLTFLVFFAIVYQK